MIFTRITIDGCLSDTGVLLRALYREDPLYAGVRTAARRLLKQEAELYTGLQQLAEFWNVSTRPAGHRSGLGLSLAATSRSLARIDRVVDILIETPSTPAIWRNLVEKYEVKGVKVHDARMVALMLSHSMSTLITLNKADFARYAPEGIIAQMPNEVLAES